MVQDDPPASSTAATSSTVMHCWDALVLQRNILFHRVSVMQCFWVHSALGDRCFGNILWPVWGTHSFQFCRWTSHQCPDSTVSQYCISEVQNTTANLHTCFVTVLYVQLPKTTTARPGDHQL